MGKLVVKTFEMRTSGSLSDVDHLEQCNDPL